ncbi:hypothetical protein [Denitrobaculum tricleocarpae]|uniref:Uncharacterized protein n=1 Tax=Denitrobaculum tricleocarpae TaxID=2591009 RepID=A0A545T5J1_9PROT|nr:hypothetical protein [Denitrobaculum tricleocarpae]TQV72484.1 hypothetical protein FKG95_25785 [Denitrobaculum tricleocarpae]
MAASPASPATVSAIEKLLKDRSATSLVNFTLGPLQVTTALLADVGKAVAAGKIKVVIDPTISHDAIYNAKSNQLQLKRNVAAPGLLERALIVHEATHAINDMRKLGRTPNIDDEAAAYIAQALYLYRNHPVKTERMKDRGNPAADRLYAAAYAAAVAIIGKKNAAAIAVEVSKVRAALKLVPQYKKTIGMSAIYSGI